MREKREKDNNRCEEGKGGKEAKKGEGEENTDDDVKERRENRKAEGMQKRGKRRERNFS